MDLLLMLFLAGIPALAVAPVEEERGRSPAPDDEARVFMDMFEAGFKNLNVGMTGEYWDFYTRGEPGRTEIFERIRSEVLSDRRTFDRLKSWRGKMDDPLLARRVELLYQIFALAQVTAQEKIYTLQNSLQKVQINFRSTYRGAPATQNQLTNVMRFEENRDLRNEAWMARNQAGKEIAPGLAKLIRMRNEEAKKLGYPGFYSMSLQLSDIDEKWLFGTLQELDRLSRAPYRRWRERLQGRIGVPALESWDVQYDYDRFQEKLKGYFPRDQILPRLKRTFSEIGLDLDTMPIRVDDRERPGKSQHAFSFAVEVPTDVRILANADDGVSSYRTLFHEMGHAVYSAGIRQPTFLLQDAASACMTEGIAQLFPLFLNEEPWLTRVAGVPEPIAKEFNIRAREDAPYGIRYYLVILSFEREAYRNPDQDLSRLWWSLTAKYLELPQHPEVESWAGIIHFTSHPAYYPNYLLADMIAAQLMHRLKKAQGSVVDSPATGEFLRSRIFARGAAIPWTRLMAETTGEPVNAKYYIEEKLGPGAPGLVE